MKLSRENIKQVALLARLRLTEDEEARFTGELDSILEYMDQLNQLDTRNIEPFRHPITVVDSLREDRVTSSPDPEALLSNAPDRHETFFKVPKIIE